MADGGYWVGWDGPTIWKLSGDYPETLAGGPGLATVVAKLFQNEEMYWKLFQNEGMFWKLFQNEGMYWKLLQNEGMYWKLFQNKGMY